MNDMTVRYYEIGGLIIEISADFDYEESGYSRFFLTNKRRMPDARYIFKSGEMPALPEKEVMREDKFRVCQSEEKTFTVFSRHESGDPEDMADYACLSYDNAADGIFTAEVTVLPAGEGYFSGSYLVFNALAVEHLFLRNGIMLLHSSFLRLKDGTALLFTGRSGIGKSTQAELWEKYEGAELINGDNALLYKRDGVWYASGLPFAGTSGVCKKAECPVKAVVGIEWSDTSTASRLSGASALKTLYSGVFQCVWHREDMMSAFDLALDYVQNMPVVLLSCTPDKSAVEALKEII